MKKFLLIVAALTLSGCAYSQFQASYLDEYKNHECQDLAKERIYAKAELGRIREERHFSIEALDGPAGSEGSYYPGYQEARMRNHARKQVIRQLQSSQGCRNIKAATNS